MRENGVEQIIGKLVQQRGARASTCCGWRPPRGSNEELSSAETLPRHPHHLHLAPFKRQDLGGAHFLVNT